jgi:glycine/D-amino acid oxidase-like deaminating enzyme
MTPFWHAALPPPGPTFPGGSQRVDVAIVGGGLSGLSAALHLLDRRPGARVVVIEAARVGAGASGRTTGMLSPGVGQSLAALVRRLGRERARALYFATLAAVREVEALVGREGIDCELAMTGQLVVARSSATRARLEAQAVLLEELELPGERLSDDALARRLRLGPIVAGVGPAALRLPVAGTLHPGRLIAGLAARVRERGGIIWERARVHAIGEPRPVRLTLDRGEVIADEVVVATAGYTPALGLLRGRVLPVHLQALVTEPLDSASRAVIGWDGREGVIDGRRLFDYYRLTRDDRVIFGGGAPRYRWGGRTDPGHDGRALAGLERALSRTFPAGARLRVAGAWSGVIGYVADALPAIQRARGRSGVVHVVGWCGHGVALSVASGAWVTSLLCDGATPQDLPWFRDRPPLVPFEPARWLGFRAATAMMAALDRRS